MFEKEAEEYLKVQCKKRKEEYVIRMPEVYIADIPQAFKDGAEFGYNKANEWHYVKDELPQDNEYVLIYTEIKNTYVARIPTGKDYFITRSGGFIQMSAVIAWKEIILPKEIKDE